MLQEGEESEGQDEDGVLAQMQSVVNKVWVRNWGGRTGTHRNLQHTHTHTTEHRQIAGIVSAPEGGIGKDAGSE